MVTKANVPFTTMTSLYHKTLRTVQEELETHVRKAHSMEDNLSRLEALFHANKFPKSLTVQPVEKAVRRDLDIIQGGNAHQRMMEAVHDINQEYRVDTLADLKKASRTHRAQVDQIRTVEYIETQVREAVKPWDTLPRTLQAFRERISQTIDSR